MYPIKHNDVKLVQHRINSYRISENQWQNVNDDDIPEVILLDIERDMQKITGFDTYCVIGEDFVNVCVHVPEPLDIEKVKVEAKCNLRSWYDGELVGTFNCSNIIHDFGPGVSPQIIASKNIMIEPEDLYDQERSFIFEVDLKVEVNFEREEEKSDLVGVYSLGKDIKKLCRDDENSDFVIRVEGKDLRCHKNILSARSDYFKGMLTGDNIETKTSSMDVRENISAETIEIVLDYIYTGDIPSENYLDIFLLRVADMYLLDGLKEACVKNLMSYLNISTCVSTLVMVDKYLAVNSPAREEVMKFMICYADEVVKLDEWKYHPELTREFLKALGKTFKEKHCCQYCLLTDPVMSS